MDMMHDNFGFIPEKRTITLLINNVKYSLNFLQTIIDFIVIL